MPCVFLLISRAALQYFYQAISPLVCGPYVYENDTLQECLLHAKMSLSFLIALICVHTSTFARRRRVTRCHDWLTGFIYNYAAFYFRFVYSGVVHVSARPPSYSPRRFCHGVKVLQLFLRKPWLKCRLCESTPPDIFRKLFIEPADFPPFPHAIGLLPYYICFLLIYKQLKLSFIGPATYAQILARTAPKSIVVFIIFFFLLFQGSLYAHITFY